MARPLRIEYPGAAYHVMARGNQGHLIKGAFGAVPSFVVFGFCQNDLKSQFIYDDLGQLRERIDYLAGCNGDWC